MTQTSPRIAVITGASSGIGKEVAKGLARKGWRIIGTGRNEARMAAAKAEIESEGAAQVDMLTADLSNMHDTLHVADAILKLTDHIDVLVNNAGGMTDKLEITPEGLEANLAGNHLGPMLLTDRLLPLLVKSAEILPKGAVRILATSSDASEMIPGINPDDLQNLATFNPGLAYCTGKLCNVFFTRALASKLADTGIVAHTMAPGAVASNFANSAPAETRERMMQYDLATEEQGADTLLWLVDCEEGASTNGGYWEHRKPRKPNPLVENPELVEDVWERSRKLISSALPVDAVWHSVKH